jgi:hypothetical protein
VAWREGRKRKNKIKLREVMNDDGVNRRREKRKEEKK